MNFNFLNINTLIPVLIILFALSLFLIYLFFGFSFYKALPLFFVDCFKKIKNSFKGKNEPFDLYGVYLYNGLGGSGKTVSMVRRAKELKKKYPKLLIMGNFHSDVVDKYFDCWQDIINTENIDENGINQGVLILFDEMHLTLNSQGWRNAPDELLEYISLQRHLHKCIMGSAQEWSRISKVIREQINYIIDCKSYLKGRLIINKCYTKENFIINGEQRGSGIRKRPLEWKSSFVNSDNLRKLYDTDEIVKSLKLSEINSDEKYAKRIISALDK